MNSHSELSRFSIGEVSVVTTRDGGHSPEFYADRIVDRLIHVAETATPHLRAQAMAYREEMRRTVLDGIRGAIQSDRTTVIARLKAAGMREAAHLVVSDLSRR